jgi:purine-binding chemotaxis protein CheW
MTPSLPVAADGGRRESRSERSSGTAFLVFDLGGLWCGLPLGEVREVLPMCDLLRPPALPPLLEGFLNLRGEAAPVIRIDRLFGLAAAPFRLHTHLVVLRRQPFAIVTERARDIISARFGDVLQPPDGNVFGGCLEGVLRADSGDISLLRVDRLLLKQEESKIAELRRIAERRIAELVERS